MLSPRREFVLSTTQTGWVVVFKISFNYVRHFFVGWQLLPVLDVWKPFCCCGSQNCQLTFEINELQLPRRSQATWEHFPTSAL